MKTLLWSFLVILLITFSAFAKDYDIHIVIGKPSAGQLKHKKWSPELDDATHTVIASIIRLDANDLILQKVLNGDVDKDSFTSDDAQYIAIKLLNMSVTLEFQAQNKKLLEEFNSFIAPAQKYNQLHFKLRRLYESCANCTHEELSESVQTLLADFDSEKFMEELTKIKQGIVLFNERIKNAIRNSK